VKFSPPASVACLKVVREKSVGRDEGSSYRTYEEGGNAVTPGTPAMGTFTMATSSGKSVVHGARTPFWNSPFTR
jgi:hypothetical protein